MMRLPVAISSGIYDITGNFHRMGPEQAHIGCPPQIAQGGKQIAVVKNSSCVFTIDGSGEERQSCRQAKHYNLASTSFT
jgi:hypothetical protein